jgi:pentatricopeptide repeat protein
MHFSFPFNSLFFTTISHVAIKQEPLLKPDHGENFVPGSESAPDHMAPQPLDHFKRGYKERADLRDRETDLRATNSDSSQVSPKVEPPCPDVTLDKGNAPVTHLGVSSKTPAPTPPPPIETRQHQRPTQSYSDSRASFRGSVGFDAVRLVEALCRPGCDLVGTLDHAKDEFAASFQSGKALTAILSNLARRRKMGIALSVWQWMEERSIEKNVYHFNSLISVCEKMKDNQRALRLLEEMDRRGIQKNEVT